MIIKDIGKLYFFDFKKKMISNLYLMIKKLRNRFYLRKMMKKNLCSSLYNLENENVFKREIDPFFLIPEKENFYLVTIWENFLWNYKWINIVDVEWFEKFS